MNSWLNQGRLRRPGRGLKSKRIRQQTIQKTASHTEFLTLPLSSLSLFLCARHTMTNRSMYAKQEETAGRVAGHPH